MYAGVPSMAPTRVRDDDPARWVSLAMPKSSTLTKLWFDPRTHRWMFSGLMSRCTIPAAWLAASAEQQVDTICRVSPMLTPLVCSRCARLSPVRASIIR